MTLSRRPGKPGRGGRAGTPRGCGARSELDRRAGGGGRRPGGGACAGTCGGERLPAAFSPRCPPRPGGRAAEGWPRDRGAGRSHHGGPGRSRPMGKALAFGSLRPNLATPRVYQPTRGLPARTRGRRWQGRLLQEMPRRCPAAGAGGAVIAQAAGGDAKPCCPRQGSGSFGLFLGRRE